MAATLVWLTTVLELQNTSQEVDLPRAAVATQSFWWSGLEVASSARRCGGASRGCGGATWVVRWQQGPCGWRRKSRAWSHGTLAMARCRWGQQRWARLTASGSGLGRAAREVAELVPRTAAKWLSWHGGWCLATERQTAVTKLSQVAGDGALDVEVWGARECDTGGALSRDELARVGRHDAAQWASWKVEFLTCYVFLIWCFSLYYSSTTSHQSRSLMSSMMASYGSHSHGRSRFDRCTGRVLNKAHR